MYRPRAFSVDDPATLHDVVRRRVFATLALAHEGRVSFAYAPVVLDTASGLGAIRFHLAKANPFAALADGAWLSVSFSAADAYVSPDWYESEGLVPTWNYIAVEGTGIARALDREGLRRLLADLSAQEEAGLLPKLPWTLEKLAEGRLEALSNAITGFAIAFETLGGKFKLSQDKAYADFEGVVGGLKARGDVASVAIAAAMRRHRRD